MKTTESGYECVIKVFLPADPRDPESMRAAMEGIDNMAKIYADAEFSCYIQHSEPRWIARRKTPASATAAAQEGAGAASPPEAAPVATTTVWNTGFGPTTIPPIADEWPEIPENLRRVPR